MAWRLACLRLLPVLLCLYGRTARADPQEIEDGEPVTLEDAFTDPAGQFSMQYSGAYARDRGYGAADGLEQGPTFKLGIVPGIQISVNPNYVSGSTEGRNAGFVLSDVLVQLNRQTTLLPAFAIDVFYSLPFGAGQKSVATTVRGIASKFVGNSETAPRLHLNISDTYISEPSPGTRNNQLQVVFGGSFLISPRDAIVSDIDTGNADAHGQNETFLEVGYSRDLPRDWTFQIGVGAKAAGGAHAGRLYFAIEKELDIY
jgi:hypothetical protein